MAEPTKGYTGVGQLTSAQQLAARRTELEQTRSDDMRNWALNRAFYRGDQWIIWNRMAGQVEGLPGNDGDKPRWKVRLTSNQILPGTQHYVALLTKNRPVIHAMPDSGSDKDIKAAQTAEALHEWWWRDLDLDLKLQSALTETTISQGYWHICWDELAGKAMTFMLGPDGQPILDDELADTFKDQLRQMQIDPEEAGLLKTVYVGDIRVDVVPGENLWIDRTARSFEDASFVILKAPMSPENVQAKYGKSILPNSAPSSGAAPVMMSSEQSQQAKATVDVYTLFHKPTAALPKGRIVTWVEEPMQIVQDDKWTYPTHNLPFVKFPGWERPGSVLDEALTTHARPLQKEFNRTLSQLVQFKDLTIKPQVFAPAGSLRTKLTDEPGAAFEYNPVNNMKPEWRQPPQLGTEAFNILAQIQARLDSIYNKVPTERNSLPARVDSGNTVELIQEAVADQITPVIRRMENSLAKAGSLMVSLAKKYYTEPRVIKIIGPGGAVRANKFANTDLDGGFSFHAVAGTGLPRSRAGRFQQIKEMLEMQLIDPHTALKHLDLSDVRGIKDKMAQDEDQALREHDKIKRGEPLNQWAAMQTPQDQMAAFNPLPFENKAVHMETHTDYMKTVEFERQPLPIQQAFMLHVQLTQQAMAAEQPVDPKTLPNLGVTARATVSAPVMAKILQKHGIETDEMEVSEEPLETAVYDSVDKPDADSAGNDQLTVQEIGLYEESLQKQTQADQNMEQDAEAHDQKMRQSAEDHAMKMAQQGQAASQKEEMHQKQLKEKPQPKASSVR